MSPTPEGGTPAADQVARLLRRVDEVRKAGADRRDPSVARGQAADLLARARVLLDDVDDTDRQLDLAEQVARRVGDLDREESESMLGPTPGVAHAPTAVDQPGRVPPGQRLTAGWPVLHVGRAPDVGDPERWRVTVTGRVRRRVVFDLAELRAMPTSTRTADLHCVTGWSRLDNRWTGIPVTELVERAGPRPEATHAIVAGHPAYSANLDLAELMDDEVLLAWNHDGQPLPVEHGGPLRLVVPSRYGWKSVKWAFEIRLADRDVPGYWEERGYHDVADPWREQRFRGD